MATKKSKCVWYETLEISFETSCQNAFAFYEEYNLIEEGFKFCPFCGDKIEIFVCE